MTNEFDNLEEIQRWDDVLTRHNILTLADIKSLEPGKASIILQELAPLMPKKMKDLLGANLASLGISVSGTN